MYPPDAVVPKILPKVQLPPTPSNVIGIPKSIVALTVIVLPVLVELNVSKPVAFQIVAKFPEFNDIEPEFVIVPVEEKVTVPAV